MIRTILGLFASLLGLFSKTPEEKERNRIKKRAKREREDSRRIADAIRKAKQGDSSLVRRILNGD